MIRKLIMLFILLGVIGGVYYFVFKEGHGKDTIEDIIDKIKDKLD